MNKEKDSLLKRLQGGFNVYGTCITSTAPNWPTAVSNIGLDFVFIDTEHVPLGRNELARLCEIYRAYDITPIVRIASPDPYLACQAIDAGAVGIVAPYLETEEQVLQLTGAVKFRPLKGEVLSGYLKGAKEMSPELSSYLSDYNEGNICIANIESVPACNRLESLLAVPGLDAVFIGPHDLSVSMGIPGQYDHPEFEEKVRFIISKTREKGLSVGIHFSLEPQRQVKWMKEGANIVVHSFDVALFSQRLQDDIALIKQAAGEDFDVNNKQELII